MGGISTIPSHGRCMALGCPHALPHRQGASSELAALVNLAGAPVAGKKKQRAVRRRKPTATNICLYIYVYAIVLLYIYIYIARK